MLSAFDPLVAEWFIRRFTAATEPQSLGWPEIRAGNDVLISAPTGSGKTLAAFLICLDKLVKAARQNTLADQTEVVYVSPLKALSNDIRKNLEIPLSEITVLAKERNIPLAPIRAAVRTGDTPAWERQQMGKQPPHILVTTPESLFILLTAEKSRQMLRSTRTLIVDEIHAIADDKRGSHLALSLARLDALTGAPSQRIGLSATVKPLEEVARFLSPKARVIDIGHRREMDLAVEVPRDELGPVASNEMWSEIYDRLAELINAHRTTLVFVNTRRLSERVAHALVERLGDRAVLPHHGSLSRALRLEAESRLKAGELQAVVATASLELGIDIGTVDLVCQIGSPRSIAVALQRFGRSGHWIGAKPKGRIFATTRDELLECGALLHAIYSGDLDRLEIPRAPLDILAQQIVAAVACEEWREDDLFGLIRSSYPYRDLSRRDFDAVIEMLSEGIATSRGRSGTYLHRDQVHGRIRARRGARLAAITSGGAIPETAAYAVVVEPEGKVVGTLDEDFAVESLAGDVFLLGTTSWRIKRVEHGRVRVEDAHGAAPTIPFWLGEAPGRTDELSTEVSKIRERLSRSPDQSNGHGLDRLGAEQARDYVAAGVAALGVLPSKSTVVAERFFDEGGGMQLVLHAPFGARINRAWGLALRKRFCRSFNFELQAAATDNGIVISLTEQHAFPLELVFEYLNSENVEHILTQALLDAPMFTARWRWNATRSLAILRFRNGSKVPAPIQRMRSDDLLAAVFPDQVACAENLVGEPSIPDHPLVNETIANCLHEAMDLDGLKRVLECIENGTIRTVAVDTSEASPFSHEILNANPYAYLDDAPLEERRALAVQLRRTLRTDVTGGIGALDQSAIDQVAEESWPVVRDPDELHDALLTLGVLPPVPEWQPFYEQLQTARRATTLRVNEAALLTAAERIDLARGAYPDGILTPPIAAITQSRGAPEDREYCATQILRGWMESIGPVRAGDLSVRLAMPLWLIETALAKLESQGQVLQGHFTPIPPHPAPGAEVSSQEWCNRRVLARIHRLTMGRLRREIEPVTTAQFLQFLCRWQHLTPGSQLHGVDGAFQIIRQLQGYEISAAAWETQVLPRRVARYEPELLDNLCLSGDVMWGRLSPHPAFEKLEPRRVRPTRVAPISIFLREDAEWLLAGHNGARHAGNIRESAPAGAIHASGPGHGNPPALSHAGQATLEQLERRGACFFADLVRSTGRLASEVEDGLWELVAAGLVTADGFENLRSLIDPKRRRGEGHGRRARPRHAAGRWALLPETPDRSEIPADAFAHQLLRRWGVVFRDLLARETLTPAWRDLLVVLRRMEARGEIRGGRFVAGYVGEQFALPEALELLRSVRRSDAPAQPILVSTADPLNLAGILLPGPRLSALSGGTIQIVGGEAVELQNLDREEALV